MRKTLFIIAITLASFIGQKAYAQTVDIYRDSVIQLYGVIMTADSLRAIPFASVLVDKRAVELLPITMVFSLLR